MVNDAAGELLAVVADVSVEQEVSDAFDRCRMSFGRLDVVVGVAGIELMGDGDGPVHQLGLDSWRRTIDVNLTGMFLTCKHGVRSLLESGGGGSVIITGSPCGLEGSCRAEHAYSASKAGTHGLVRVMAAEYANHGIRVNCVIPGFIDTPLTSATTDDPALLKAWLADIPLGRVGRPEDLVGAFVLLASDESAYMTGSFITVDGGMTAV